MPGRRPILIMWHGRRSVICLGMFECVPSSSYVMVGISGKGCLLACSPLQKKQPMLGGSMLDGGLVQ